MTCPPATIRLLPSGAKFTSPILTFLRRLTKIAIFFRTGQHAPSGLEKTIRQPRLLRLIRASLKYAQRQNLSRSDLGGQNAWQYQLVSAMPH